MAKLTDTFDKMCRTVFYFPCSVCALRTFKAEIGYGLEREQIELMVDLVLYSLVKVYG